MLSASQLLMLSVLLCRILAQAHPASKDEESIGIVFLMSTNSCEGIMSLLFISLEPLGSFVCSLLDQAIHFHGLCSERSRNDFMISAFFSGPILVRLIVSL